MQNLNCVLPQGRMPRNIPVFIVAQIENEGVEVKIEKLDNGLYGAHRVNPLKKMYEEGKLTRQEWKAAEKYQKNFKISLEDNHARQTLIWDGLSHSSASSRNSDNTPHADYLEACRYVAEMKKYIQRECSPRQISGFKDFKNFKKKSRNFSIDRKYSDILEIIFGFERSIRKSEIALGSDHRTLEARVKKICEIMLDFKLPAKYSEIVMMRELRQNTGD